MNDRTPPSLSEKTALVLRLLVQGEMYGLQLVDASAGQLKRGTVYVTLGRMEQRGLVVSRQEPRHPGAIGLPRRLYAPTELGRAALAAREAAEATFLRTLENPS